MTVRFLWPISSKDGFAIRLHGQIFAPCKICISHIPVSHAGGRAPTVGALGDAGAVTEQTVTYAQRRHQPAEVAGGLPYGESTLQL